MPFGRKLVYTQEVRKASLERLSTFNKSLRLLNTFHKVQTMKITHMKNSFMNLSAHAFKLLWYNLEVSLKSEWSGRMKLNN